MSGVLTAFVGGSFGGAPATYAVAAAGGATSVNEGSSLQFNVTGTNIVNGTYYWTVTNSGDFATSSGSFTITNNAGSFTVTPSADGVTEGAETFQAQVRTTSTSGTVVATSASITINDTSIGPWRLLEKFSDTAYALETMGLDSSGNIYALASNTSGNRSHIAKFSSSGTRLEKYYLNNTSVNPSRYKIVGTNLYVGSTNANFPYGGQDSGVFKFNSSTLATIDFQRYIGTSGNQGVRGLDIDSGGNYIIHSYDTSSTLGIASLLKMNSSGTAVWRKNMTGIGSTTGNISAGGACVDSSDNVYASGTYSPSTKWLIKYNSSGTLQWRKSWTDDSGTPNIIHYNGFIYLMLSNPSLTRIYKFDTSGNLQWVRHQTLTTVSTDFSVGPNGILFSGLNSNSSVYYYGILNLDGTAGTSWRITTTINQSYVLGNGGAFWTSDGKIVASAALYRSATANDHYMFLTQHTTTQGTANIGTIEGGTYNYNFGQFTISWTTSTTPTFSTTELGSTNTSATHSIGTSTVGMTQSAAASSSIKTNL